MANIDVEEQPSTILKIPVPKGKGYIEVDTAKLPNHVYQEFLVQGGKVLVNRGMTTFTKEKYPDADELQEVAMERAEKNLNDLYAGKVTIRGASKEGKVSREVMTAARNIARKMVKEVLKRKKVKITTVKPSDITKAADVILANDPSIIERAKKELEELEKDSKLNDLDIDIQADPALVAAQEKKRADKTLSAKQAGRVSSRVR